MSDFSTRARETAEREAKRLMPLTGGAMDPSRETYQHGYTTGFTTAVSRLPSEEEISEAVKPLV